MHHRRDGQSDGAIERVHQLFAAARIAPVALPLGAAVAEVVRALNYDIEEKNVRLEIKPTHFVEADDQLFRQAFFNLVLNAIQAARRVGKFKSAGAPKRGGDPRDPRQRSGRAPENRTEIFKPYFTTQPKGTGLGLAVVQQIVRRTAGKSSASRTNRTAPFSGSRISRS